MKKIFSFILAAVVVFGFTACGGARAVEFTPEAQYEFADFVIEDVSTLFSGLSVGEVFESNIGTISDKRFSLTLPAASTVSVEITAKEANVVNKFNITVQKQSYDEIYGEYDDVVKGYLIKSATLMDTVLDNYWNNPAYLGLHFYPNYLTHEVPSGMTVDNSTAFVWPYTELAAGMWRLTSINKQSARQVHYYRATLHGFEYYLADRNDYHAYVAVRSNRIGGAAGDTYYDDNIWIAREMLNAYEVLGDEEYLTKCLDTLDYIWSGYADDEIGGIYWLEQKKESRNACSNAPAIILFARVYEVTGDEVWLDRAKACYDFVNDHLVDSNGVILDNISNEGRVDYAKYTYNSGSFISGAIKLFEITEDEKYLTAAEFTAEGSHNYFFKYDAVRGYRTINMNSPWFNVLLLDGYIELYKHNKDALKYVETFKSNLDYAYEHFVNEQGFMSTNWVNGGFGNKLNVLDMAANAENFGQLAHFYLDVFEK